MKPWSFLVLVLLGISPSPGDVQAADLQPEPLPRIAPTEPQAALSTFEVREGFHLELAASEPLVVDPIALSFDEMGRLFVVEMRGYSELRDAHMGRVRMLVDADGDGFFDQSTVYVDGLPWPTAVLAYDGGVFVGATPDILYCKDEDGDGRAEVRETVFTGFGSDYAPYQTNRLNVQAMLNSFTWGLDNRIHGATGPNGGEVVCAKFPDRQPLSLRGRDFSFDPRTLELRVESGGGQYGLSFDETGSKFVCSNSDHLQAVLYEARYAPLSPQFTLPPARISIAEDGPAAEVFRISPDEPWRVVRTRWRVAGLVPGPIEGGGRPSGYFTAATGLTIYRGHAWPEEFHGDAFIADCGSNLIHRKKLERKGVAWTARRPVDEQATEFIRSTDNWFRPVQLANGPDGCLYIADMYREVIEHPWSLPEPLKRQLDLNSGNDRGRIYRVVPDNWSKPQRPALGTATVGELVSALDHQNGWHRETAARLLYERRDPASIPLLRDSLQQSSASWRGRLHALYALHSLQSLTTHDLVRSFGDKAPAVRAHALRLAEELAPQDRADFWSVLESMATDPEPMVRYQLAWTLGRLRSPDRVEHLTRLIVADPASRWIRTAVLASGSDLPAQLYERLANDAPFRATPGGLDFLSELIRLVGAQQDSAAIERLLADIPEIESTEAAFRFLRALDEGLKQSGSRLEREDEAGRLRSVLARAEQVAHQESQSLELRVQAVEALGALSVERALEELAPLLDPRVREEIQVAVLKVLSERSGAEVAKAWLGRWSGMTPRLKSIAVELMLRSPGRTWELVEALDRGTVAIHDLSMRQKEALRRYRDPNIRKRAAKMLGARVAEDREATVARFRPSLSLKGTIDAGRRLFEERCASCHRFNGEGYNLGPDLASVQSSGREALLTKIIDPNGEVAPQYVAYEVETDQEEVVTGLIEELPGAIRILQANGLEQTIPRAQVRSVRSSGLSLMPVGLEEGLEPEEMAHLLEFIESTGSIGKSANR